MQQLPRDAVAVDGRQHGFGGPLKIALGQSPPGPCFSSIGPISATRSASGPMVAPRVLAPTSVGAPISETTWAVGAADIGRERKRLARTQPAARADLAGRRVAIIADDPNDHRATACIAHQ